LHLGTQHLAHDNDPGLPSDHVTVLWSLALATLASRRFAAWGFPLLAIGLAVGWSRVYLGVHFPFDVIAALPVAFVGVLLAHAARRPLLPVSSWVLRSYDRLALALRPGTRAPPTRES
jgi:undecaprenyl-diphosphatase